MDGEVDGRSIKDVTPADIMDFERVHVFCGIAGWDHALNLARWQGPVWTGSCPCQSLLRGRPRQRGLLTSGTYGRTGSTSSGSAGLQSFLEKQVARKLALSWLDLVFDDLEAEGYAVGAADLCAASVGAPHIRQRLWFVRRGRLPRQRISQPGKHHPERSDGGHRTLHGKRLAHASSPGIGGGNQRGLGEGRPKWVNRKTGRVLQTNLATDAEDAQPIGRHLHRQYIEAKSKPPMMGNRKPTDPQIGLSGRGGASGELADTADWLRCGDPRKISDEARERQLKRGDENGTPRTTTGSWRRTPVEVNFWHPCAWLPCRDGKWRPIGPVESSSMSRLASEAIR